MTSLSKAYLEFKGLSKTFKKGRTEKVKAVVDFNLTVSKGEFLTIIGPSGCGKTTILRTIAGFEEPTSGDIFLEGRSLSSISAQKRNMPMVFQSFALFPHMTVYQNIAYGLKIKKLNRNSIAHEIALACQMVDLTGVEHRFPGELSGGQQQRVALARALVLKPDIILCDEPLSNLDISLRIQTRNAIRRVQKLLGITVLYVTHDNNEALSISDRIVLMRKGRIIQVGTPQDVYANPISPFVSDFIGSANFLDGYVTDKNHEHVYVMIDRHEYKIPQSQCEQDLEMDHDVLIAVRPESIQLVPVSATSICGTVEQIAFHGPFTEYTLGIGDGWLRTIQTSGKGKWRQYQLGEQVGVELDPQSFHVYGTHLE